MNDAKQDRSSPLPTSGQDRTTAELEALEAELLAGILTFSTRSAQPIQPPAEEVRAATVPPPAMAPAAPARAATAPLSPLPPAAPRAEPRAEPRLESAPPADVAAPPASGGVDLLAELRAAAMQAKSADEVDARRLAERRKVMGTAMRQIFDYLNEFARHLDTLKPEVAHVFRLSPQVQIGGLAWASSFVDFRRVGSSEYANIDSVSLRYTLAADRPTMVVSPPHLAMRHEDELLQVGLNKYVQSERRNSRGGVEAVVFEVLPEIKVSLQFKAEIDDDRIVIRGQNFRGFGKVAYTIAPTAVDKAMLDELGRYLIGRPSPIFSHWQPLAL